MNKMKIGVGYFVTSKVGVMEKTREGESIRTRNDLVGCVRAPQRLKKIKVSMVFL